MNIPTSLTVNARRYPEKVAIVCEGRTYSYRELDEEVNRFANGLVKKGLQKGDKVSLFMKNSEHFIIAFYAVLRVGGVAVPVNYRLDSQDSSYIFRNSESAFAICDAEFEQLVAEAKQQAEHLHQVIVNPAAQQEDHFHWDEVKSEDASAPAIEVLDRDDAEILYTSGTTGDPKGALFDHQRIFQVNTAFALSTGLTTNDRLIHAVPLFHAAQLNQFLVTGILLGATNVIVRDFEPVQVMESFSEHQITVFFGLPEMYNMLLEVQSKEQYDVSSVRKCLYGADPIETSLIEKAMEFFGGSQFYNLCVVTEGGPGGVMLSAEEHKTKSGVGGKAMLFTEARVVDDEFKDVEPGKIGEFILKSGMVMKEYYGLPEETEEAFSDGWLLTGDLATIDEDGYISLVDRKQDRIISAGENIYSVEVEQAINSHPKVLESATVGLPEEEWGEIVGVIIVPKEGETIEEEELMSHCLKHLDGHKIPKKFLFADELPRNASGKVLKYQLRDLHISEFTWFKPTASNR
ncbi:class I adenylate-forming enzyme family protein [Planococcus salinus]|uniref:Long-chain-fatty-acid--CoA ligase n=1 Tax=Planococcus salinus TaxID=1848460 RepID=A0A3M8P716_9BACL|nr:long-chain-fatty-acid--CoA ligase [Planococcus salinus]RNF38984.1 long-chain-fatty-acid--CoA ligase [Planococcus salinus]